MELVTLKLTDIKPYERNARKNDQAVAAVAESIRQCEYIAPIIVDENHVILAGHTRWKALKLLGKSEVECVVKSGLTDEQKQKYRLLDNKTAEFAEWDFDLLADELNGLDFGGFDFGFFEENGFSDEELEQLMQDEVNARSGKSVHRVTVDLNNEEETRIVEGILKKNGYNPKVQNT